MRKIIKIENNEASILKLEWNTSNTCNYKCHYCFPGANEGTIPFPKIETLEILKKNFVHLFDYYLESGKNKIQLYLVGGEPTLWKHLPEFLLFLKNRYQNKLIVQVSTNGYRKLDWWKENAKFFDHIEISVHNEFCNIDHILEVSDYLFSNKHMVVTNVLMDPYNFEISKNNVDYLITNSKYNWPVIAKYVMFGDSDRYTEEQLAYFQVSKKRIPQYEEVKDFFKGTPRQRWVTFDDKEVFEMPADNWISINKLNHFFGWSCNLGVEALNISFSGDISGSCLQKLFDKSDYFNIFDSKFSEEFSPALKPVICRQVSCTCGAEIMINKNKL